MAKLNLIKDASKIATELRNNLKGFFSEGISVAVKVHMGEKGNKYFIKAPLIKEIVGVLKSLGLRPFLFDSVVLYAGARDTVEKYLKTAEEHGFTKNEIGCPIVVSDSGIKVTMEDHDFFVCKELAEAEAMLVVSHVKGHCCYGFGGAIKNLGMGGVTPKSKEDIHTAQYVSSDKLLAESAGAVLKSFTKVFYINFLTSISKECDCCSNAGPLVADDIGILLGSDIVSIDRASVDLVYNQKPAIFEKLHKKDPYLQIKYAFETGIGEWDYEIG